MDGDAQFPWVLKASWPPTRLRIALGIESYFGKPETKKGPAQGSSQPMFRRFTYALNFPMKCFAWDNTRSRLATIR